MTYREYTAARERNLLRLRQLGITNAAAHYRKLDHTTTPQGLERCRAQLAAMSDEIEQLQAMRKGNT